MEISVNGKSHIALVCSTEHATGAPFVEAAPTDSAATIQESLFTENSAVFVGGVTQACGFIGDIAEVSVACSGIPAGM